MLTAMSPSKRTKKTNDVLQNAATAVGSLLGTAVSSVEDLTSRGKALAADASVRVQTGQKAVAAARKSAATKTRKAVKQVKAVAKKAAKNASSRAARTSKRVVKAVRPAKVRRAVTRAATTARRTLKTAVAKAKKATSKAKTARTARNKKR